MSILLVSFSVRKSPGNCIRIVNYISQILDMQEIDFSKLEMKNYKIEACFNCNYECFSFNKECPKNDDVIKLYKKVSNFDIFIMVIPVYSEVLCSKYFSWRERSQCVFKNNDLYSKYKNVKKNYIVIGNEEAGGKTAVNVIKSYQEEYGEIMLLQSHKHNQKSLDGNLIECKDVKIKIKRYIEQLVL